MDILLSILDDLALSVLQDWLQLKDIVRINVAYTGLLGHPQLSQILSKGLFLFPDLAQKNDLKCMCVAWLNTHGVKVSNLVFPALPPVQHEACRSYLKRFGSSVQKLRISNCSGLEPNQDTILTDCMAHCPNVVELEILFELEWSESFLRRLNTAHPLLETLNTAHFYIQEHDYLNDVSSWKFAALSSLHVDYGNLDAGDLLFLAKVTPHLKSLTLKFMSVELMPADEWRSLRHLELTNCNISEESWPNLAHLTSLQLFGNGRFVTSATLKNIADNCINLTTLALQCADVSNDDLRYLLERCPKLTELYLLLFNITLLTLQTICKSCPLLSKLHLPCSYITEKGLLWYARRCNGNLKYVEYTTSFVKWAAAGVDTAKEVFEQKGAVVNV